MKGKWAKFIATNLVTSIRVIGVAALFPIFKLYGGLVTALTCAGCFLTDFIDGKMARNFECSSFFGSILDGVSDKGFLIVNMLILMTINPLTIIPILLELGIVGAQSIKFKSNMNIQSNFIGKVKTWIAGLVVSLEYLFVDKNVINFLGANLATKIEEYGEVKLFGLILLPLVLSEILTLGSYLKEYSDSKYEESEETKEKALEESTEEEEDITISKVLFDHEFYEKYKDQSNMLDVLKLTRKKKNK